MPLGADSNAGILSRKIQRMFKGCMCLASPIPSKTNEGSSAGPAALPVSRLRREEVPENGADRKELSPGWDTKSQALVTA